MQHRRIQLISALVGVLVVCGQHVVHAVPGPVVQDGSVATATGDHSAGIASGVDFPTPPITTLNINSLSSIIDPAAGAAGIFFENTQGGAITINSGNALTPIIISTEGVDAIGIYAVGEGEPATYEWLAGLGVWAPDGPSGAGGPVQVVSYSNITTDGESAHGILAQNKIGTYDPISTSTLMAFSTDDVDMSLTSVEGSAANIGAAVPGDNGGFFTLFADGTWDFDASDFNDVLAVGETAVTRVDYEVDILHVPADPPYGSQSSSGSFAMNVTKTGDSVFETVPAIYFDEFDQFSDPEGAQPLWPDLQDYVDALLADMGISGAGQSINVTNTGSITTYGDSSHGIYAQTEGGRGSAGTSGTFWDAGVIPTSGGPGSNGGSVTVDSNGTIVTAGESSAGIAVLSTGGSGGKGGDGGPWRFGARGGTGGTGGDIMVTGTGEIHTLSDYASGVLAVSEGGIGGTGGSGSGVTGGGNGGFGGKGGSVSVIGDWDITTYGDKAHGIWAKSVGGSAGAGGSGGWLFGSPGSGGQASDGGSVTVDSNGIITTYGNDAYGIYGESVGGFGGSGGTSFGLFWAFGGDAGSAGSGSGVSITNGSDGDITTFGENSHAIFAQSVGGGGGSGGGMFGLFYSLGGEGGSGGYGSTVDVSNAASIRTYGFGAKGIYAQSVGGGGGDGGWGGGVVAIGGSGSEASHAGDVTVFNSGDITTDGNSADAIFAQSVGGGGGSSGALGGLVSIGSTGEGGGDGGDVTVENSGALTTNGPLARGIVAQSIGGGGGDGTTSVGLLANVGSSGGGSGNASSVYVNNSGSITTSLEDSTAIFAQSVGGGGGSVAGSGALTVSIGGTAGSSGDGNTVTVINSGSIVTDANRSEGIVAQSIGAGGGRGAGSGALVWSVGGDANSSGSGGAVSVANSGSIETSGYASGAIVAQSIGGGGGIGSGDANDVEGAGGGAGGFSIIYSYGGDAQGAGHGGDVNVVNSADLTTSGDASTGIFAQSVGGGGGKGEIAGALAVAEGGDGGASGNGGNISINNSGAITTTGDDSYGIFAQSIGGGGGSTSTAGHSAWSFAVSNGGKGGSGGDAGDIDITTSSRIETHGINSSGILAQSVGGGGGSAGDVKTISAGLFIEIGSAVGGDGGDGGDGGAVTIDSNSDIITHGQNSQGIIAQSIGGGGGNAGSSVVWAFTLIDDVIEEIIDAFGDPLPFSFEFHQSIGGDGGVTGVGSAVNVTSSGDIFTSGSHSPAILAQSIGGGGGNGGSGFLLTGGLNGDYAINLVIGGNGGSGGNGGPTDVNSSGAIWTQGAHSSGIVAQSVGGGGGTGGDAQMVDLDFDLWIPTGPDDLLDLIATYDAKVVLGGSGGASGTGSSVNVLNSDTIITEGAFSSGILAQSIGGGGGAGGHASVYEIQAGDPVSTLKSIALDVEYDFVLGGNGGAGGDAGNVTVTNSGDIFTTGAFGMGILAQSVGGGGGAGGNVFTFNVNGLDAFGVVEEQWGDLIDLGSMSMTLEGSGGAGGNGGNVNVTNTGDIWTQGAFAHGILAQSVGGGGGSAGMSETANMSTLLFGPNARGVSSDDSGLGVWFAGSLGASGSGGYVTVNQTGNVIADGNEAHAIFAQSVGGSGGHNISVNIVDGIIRGGSGSGAGVYIDGGANNTLNNAGYISALSGMAIVGGARNETINNNGIIVGNVNLGAGTNVFNNNLDGFFISASSADLGTGQLINSGTLSPGGVGTLQTTALTGNVTQTDSGIFAVDLDLETRQTDRLNVTGTSNLDGLASITVLNKEFVVPMTHETTIISSAAGVTDSGLDLLTEPSAVIDYRLLFVGATDVNLETTIDFSPSGKGLTRNQMTIGNTINTILTAGGSPSLTPYVLQLIDLPNGDSLGRAYDQLSPESYDTATATTYEVTQQYTQTLVKRMHSVRSHMDTTGRLPGANQTLKHAAWMEGFGQWADQDADNGFTGFEYDVAGAAFGLDYLLDDGLLAGISYSRANTDIDLDDNKGSGDIESDFISLYGSLFSDKMYFDGAFSYASQSYDNKRRIQVGELASVARSDHDGDAYSAYAEAGYNCEYEKWLVQPFGSLQYTYLDEDSFTEYGADGVNLLVKDRQTDSLVSQLGTRFYHPFKSESWDWIPELSLAWRHDFDVDDRQMTAAFDSAPGVAFTTDSRDVDQDGVVIGTGMTLMNRSGLSLSIKYSSEFRGDYKSHVLYGGLRYEF